MRGDQASCKSEPRVRTRLALCTKVQFPRDAKAIAPDISDSQPLHPEGGRRIAWPFKSAPEWQNHFRVPLQAGRNTGRLSARQCRRSVAAVVNIDDGSRKHPTARHELRFRRKCTADERAHESM
jgi:hypothetical protein